jgi:hypothetical protein
VETAAITPFGKEIKKRLIDSDRNQAWLIDRVSEKTGLYFDRSYMNKIMKGQLCTPKIVNAICEILEIPNAPTS